MGYSMIYGLTVKILIVTRLHFKQGRRTVLTVLTIFLEHADGTWNGVISLDLLKHAYVLPVKLRAL